MRSRGALILCVGSRLMGDDAVGLVIGDILLKHKHMIPAEIKVFESGCDVFALLDEVAGFDEVVIIDAVKSGLAPGEVVVMDLGELIQESACEIQSLHDVDVISAIRLGYELYRDRMPRRIILIGVGIRSLSLGMGLSGEVEEAIPKILEEVFRILELDPSNLRELLS